MAATSDHPRLSVVIPLYNKAGQIARALDSVRTQTVRDIEVIVVDDGSTDGGADIVQACGDARVRLHRQPNGGVAAARNQGVALSRCPLVAFLDADDAWHPDHLERLWRLRLAHPGAVGWATNYEIVEPDGRRTPGVRSETAPHVVLTPENFYRIALQGSPVCSSAVMVDKEALLRKQQEIYGWWQAHKAAVKGSVEALLSGPSHRAALGEYARMTRNRIPLAHEALRLGELLRHQSAASIRRRLANPVGPVKRIWRESLKLGARSSWSRSIVRLTLC